VQFVFHTYIYSKPALTAEAMNQEYTEANLLIINKKNQDIVSDSKTKDFFNEIILLLLSRQDKTFIKRTSKSMWSLTYRKIPSCSMLSIGFHLFINY
jgi:hypothetical protein